MQHAKSKPRGSMHTVRTAPLTAHTCLRTHVCIAAAKAQRQAALPQLRPLVAAVHVLEGEVPKSVGRCGQVRGVRQTPGASVGSGSILSRGAAWRGVFAALVTARGRGNSLRRSFRTCVGHLAESAPHLILQPCIPLCQHLQSLRLKSLSQRPTNTTFVGVC